VTANLTAAQYCDLFEATAPGVPGLPGVFILGSFSEPPVTVASQQTRAVNLVHSLIEKRLSPGDSICVIGAGAAGLTAAAYAIAHGFQTVVFDIRSPLWNLRGCRTRWLHPNLFLKWPEEGWDQSGTDLPVMNWYAGYAHEVGDLLWEKYQTYDRLNYKRGGQTLQLVRSIGILRNGKSPTVKWTAFTDSIEERNFAAVIVATGFGTESPRRDASAASYWLDDSLERDNETSTRYLISGSGDGGLTDLLRVRIHNFRHHHLREILLSLKSALLSFDLPDLVRSAELETTPRAITDAYFKLAKNVPKDRLPLLTRRNTSVLLTNDGDAELKGRSWPVARFLASVLLTRDVVDTRYKAGPPVSVTPVLGVDTVISPREFTVTFPDRTTETVNAVIYRHGPGAAADTILRDLGLSGDEIKSLRRKWTGTVSDQPLWPKHTTNYDSGQRNTKSSLQGPIAGRTIPGMLSRLVGQIGPDCEDLTERLTDIPPALASRPRDQLMMDDDLVQSLVPHGDKLVPGSPAGWRLAGEVHDEPIIAAVSIADASLDKLGEDLLRAQSLTRHWILPRPEWSGLSGLLVNTCVARHWCSWQLEYRRINARTRARAPLIRQLSGSSPLGRNASVIRLAGSCTSLQWDEMRSAKRRSLIAIAAVDGGAIPKGNALLFVENEEIALSSEDRDPVLVIVDLVHLERRIAFRHEPMKDPPEAITHARRLARELEAELLCTPSTFEWL